MWLHRCDHRSRSAKLYLRISAFFCADVILIKMLENQRSSHRLLTSNIRALAFKVLGLCVRKDRNIIRTGRTFWISALSPIAFAYWPSLLTLPSFKLKFSRWNTTPPSWAHLQILLVSIGYWIFLKSRQSPSTQGFLLPWKANLLSVSFLWHREHKDSKLLETKDSHSQGRPL